jgi:broad specificity phosphatase PhoE
VTRLVLVAHAATEATRTAAFSTDEALDAQGTAAVRAAVPVRRHDSAVSSPARRCRETAAGLGLRPSIDPALRDCDFGRWQGRRLEEVSATSPDEVRAWLDDPDAAPHGGESIRALLERVRTWLHGHPPTAGTTVAVTHPAVVRAAIVAALAAGPAAFWRIDISPLTETILVGGDTRWSLRSTGLPLAPR